MKKFPLALPLAMELAEIFKPPQMLQKTLLTKLISEKMI